MRHFIAFSLMIVLSFTNFGQDEKPKPQQVKPKIAAKTKKIIKVKPKTKAKPKVTVIEAATKDGKAVTLKSNGTWEYVKAEAAATPSPSPTATPTPTPTPAPTVKPTPTANPNPVIKPTPVPTVAVEKPLVPKPTPNAKTAALLLSKQCDLSLKDAPVIRGLKLGMPREEADKIIPSDRVRFLNSSAITAYPQFSRAAGFENVYQITANFSDEKLDILEIVYDPNAVKWNNAKEYAENLSQNFTLPYRFWKFNAKTPAISEMRCSEFSIMIDSEQNGLRLEKQAVIQKSVKAKEENKKVFKP